MVCVMISACGWFTGAADPGDPKSVDGVLCATQEVSEEEIEGSHICRGIGRSTILRMCELWCSSNVCERSLS